MTTTITCGAFRSFFLHRNFRHYSIQESANVNTSTSRLKWNSACGKSGSPESQIVGILKELKAAVKAATFEIARDRRGPLDESSNLGGSGSSFSRAINLQEQLMRWELWTSSCPLGAELRS